MSTIIANSIFFVLRYYRYTIFQNLRLHQHRPSPGFDTRAQLRSYPGIKINVNLPSAAIQHDRNPATRELDNEDEPLQRKEGAYISPGGGRYAVEYFRRRRIPKLFFSSSY
ncbi:uncharacterized protein ARMOST_22435 [Armillaria ostoyae]|uniref:Uncharacterized protein n=1 Tax=Armillaria ostoyae TaxID=47428 RepID=A0A284SCW9_ARMOS|nr:uncharacterized protein ARMOST_22435 [Armillaria ostoyae]